MAADRRRALLETAERLFYEEGFHATGIDRVVTEAGIARMTLYNHFRSKDALVEAVLTERHARYLASLEAAPGAADDAEPLVALVTAHCEWLAGMSRHGCMLVKAMGEYERHAGAIHERARQCKEAVLALLERAATHSGRREPVALAGGLFLVFEGANQMVPVAGVAATRRYALATTQALLAAHPLEESRS